MEFRGLKMGLRETWNERKTVLRKSIVQSETRGIAKDNYDDDRMA